MGDKTQVATVALAAQYHAIVLVVLGTTAGMMLANVPVVFAGDALMRRVPLKWIRIVAALSFLALGAYALAFAASRLNPARQGAPHKSHCSKPMSSRPCRRVPTQRDATADCASAGR